MLVILLHAILMWQQTQTIMGLGWHIATKTECDAEYWRELKAMNSAGIYGDPSISLGWAADGWKDGKPEWWSSSPCGYASDSKPTQFRTRYQHNDADVTECDYYIKSGWTGYYTNRCLALGQSR